MIKDIFVHSITFIVSLLVVAGIVVGFHHPLASYFAKHSVLPVSYHEVLTAKAALECGEISVYGSSELTHNEQEFIPHHFFERDNTIPLRVVGKGFYQNFLIFSELVTFYNEKSRKNARIVVLISPTWFYGSNSKGVNTQAFLDGMNRSMMYEFLYHSDAEPWMRKRLAQYIEHHAFEMQPMSFLYQEGKNYGTTKKLSIIDRLVQEVFVASLDTIALSPRPCIVYPQRAFNFDSLFTIAQEKERELSTNNSWGMHNSYYSHRVLEHNHNFPIPYALASPFPLDQNQEYQDFLGLVSLLKTFTHPPLFVLLDMNINAHTNGSSVIVPLYDSITTVVQQAGFDVYNMWTSDSSSYFDGSFIDDKHPGEAAWVRINEQIAHHFFKDSL